MASLQPNVRSNPIAEHQGKGIFMENSREDVRSFLFRSSSMAKYRMSKCDSDAWFCKMKNRNIFLSLIQSSSLLLGIIRKSDETFATGIHVSILWRKLNAISRDKTGLVSTCPGECVEMEPFSWGTEKSDILSRATERFSVEHRNIEGQQM